MLAAGDGFGGGQADPRERIQVEFVSANPTGPLTAASGRHAAYGDALRRILRFTGHEVEGEYYFNDTGAQVAPPRRVDPGPRPRRGAARGRLPGRLRARSSPSRSPARPSSTSTSCAAKGVELIIARIRATLDRLPGRVRQLVPRALAARRRPDARCGARFARLEEQGTTYRADGALWLRTSALGDDKDRVLERSNGEPTYFASDVAYTRVQARARLRPALHRARLRPPRLHRRGCRRSMAALGADPDRLEIPILQFVHIVERGERASMSKRRGDFITLDDLIAEIGVDATRFFMLQRSHDSTVDLDLDLARQRVGREPRLLRPVRPRADRARSCARPARSGSRRRSPQHGAGPEPGARARRAGADQEAARVPGRGRRGGRAPRAAPDRHLRARAGAGVHGLLPRLPVVGAEPEALESFRIGLSVASKRTIARSLDLLGVSAPESM